MTATQETSEQVDTRLRLAIANYYTTRADLLRHILDGERRDLDSDCGYPHEITPEQYWSMFKREGIARRVVRCWPAECWCVEPMVYETEEQESTQFEQAWETLNTSKRLYHYMERLDVLSGVGRYGILLLGVEDGQELSSPVVPKANLSLGYLRVFADAMIVVSKFDTDTRSPRYGRPLEYNVRIDENGTSRTLRVHYSRVVHVADNCEESEIFGTPRMQPVYNRLYDLRKTLGGSAEMFWRGAFPGMAFEVMPDLVSNPDFEISEDTLKAQFQKYSDGLQRYIALRGISAKQFAPAVGDPTSHISAQLDAIAITMEIPKRVLFGSEQAQLASEQDSNTWAKRVKGRQNKYVTPMVVRAVVDRLIELGILPKPQSYVVQWPDISSPTDVQKADLADKRVTTIAKYVAGDVSSLLPPYYFLTMILGMSTLEADAIMEEMSGSLEAEERDTATGD